MKISYGFVIASLLLAGCEKARLDQQVKELCAKDGGVKVYETVTLPPERFDEFGNVRIPSEQNATASDEYFHKFSIIYYSRGNPEMYQSNYRIIRRRDQKVLGEAVDYARRGGDMPGPWHDSSFGCRDIKEQVSVDKLIFLKGETK